MPQDLRVVPWEQFNSYHEEILEKIDRVPPTVQADEGKILVVSDSDGALEGVYPQSGGVDLPGFDAQDSGKILTVSASDNTAFLDGAEPQSSGGGADLPIYDSSYKNKVLTVKENESNGDIELAGDLVNIKDGYGGEIALPDTEEEDGDYVLTLMTGGSQKIEGMRAPEMPDTSNVDPGQVLMTGDLGTEGRAVNFVPDYSDINDKRSLITDGAGNIQGGDPLPDYSWGEVNSALVVNNDLELEWQEIIPIYQSSDAGKVLTPNDDGNLVWSDQLLPLFDVNDTNAGQFLSASSTGDALSGVDLPYIPDIPRPSTDSSDDGKILVVVGSGDFALMDWETYQNNYINN